MKNEFSILSSQFLIPTHPHKRNSGWAGAIEN